MMQQKFRVLSAITAGGLALGAAAIGLGSGTGHAATHSALDVRAESSQPVNLDACPALHTGYPAGRCVVQLQTDLNSIQGDHLAVDGVFGPPGSQTDKAVIAFQAAHGLREDGIVGPDTKKALDAALSPASIATHSAAAPAPASAAAPPVTNPAYSTMADPSQTCGILRKRR
jgi:peptidoglycan hydrolase-like protein with peptidoglycan-binding domain